MQQLHIALEALKFGGAMVYPLPCSLSWHR